MFPAANGLVARALTASLTQRDGPHGANGSKSGAGNMNPAVAGGLVSLLVLLIYVISISVCSCLRRVNV